MTNKLPDPEIKIKGVEKEKERKTMHPRPHPRMWIPSAPRAAIPKAETCVT